MLNPTRPFPARRSSDVSGVPTFPTRARRARLPLFSAQEPVEFDGNDAATLPGRAGGFAGVQTPLEAGDLILGPPEMPWDDALGAATRADERQSSPPAEERRSSPPPTTTASKNCSCPPRSTATSAITSARAFGSCTDSTPRERAVCWRTTWVSVRLFRRLLS